MSTQTDGHDEAPAEAGGLLRSGPGQAEIRRDVLSLAIPAMGEQLLSMMVGIVDTYLVGHLGPAPLAAVGLANQWVMMATTLFGAVATGSTALIARFIGAKEPEDANRVVQQSVLLGIAIGVAATFLGVTFAEPAVRLLGAPADVVDLSRDYLAIVATIFLFSTLMFIGNACLRGAGDTRTPLYVMLVVNTLNIIVAWTAINGPFGLPKLGVAGSAMGAAVGRGVGGILVVIILLHGRSGIQLRIRRMLPDTDLLRRLLRVGLPSGVEQLFFRTGSMAFARILAELGTNAYAASQVGISAWSLSFMPGFGFAVAATTLVGQSLGAELPERAGRQGYTAFRLGAGLMAAVGILFLLFPARIVGFFTNDPEVIALGTMPLRMVGLIQPLLAANMIFGGALRGAGDTRFPMVVTGVGVYVLRLPIAYLFAVVFGWGLVGAWGALIFDFTSRGVLNFLRFRSGRWKAVRV